MRTESATIAGVSGSRQHRQHQDSRRYCYAITLRGLCMESGGVVKAVKASPLDTIAIVLTNPSLLSDSTVAQDVPET
ncbi:hypothetical protein E2C01_038575 [Portunus trituberculatus]|uniref:Uncharacterized protein n=1 Tax=Portunus trituberculatus TaxID=210409 RepID=A0A5B7FKH4_PORTR|nr:hypothetical protein [Portunus trituberculatus]